MTDERKYEPKISKKERRRSRSRSNPRERK